MYIITYIYNDNIYLYIYVTIRICVFEAKEGGIIFIIYLHIATIYIYLYTHCIYVFEAGKGEGWLGLTSPPLE